MSRIDLALTRKVMNREFFMGAFILSVGGLATIVYGVPIVGFLLGSLIKQPNDVWRDVGAVNDWKVGEMRHIVFQYPDQLQWAGSTSETVSWVRRNQPSQPTPFTAFAVYCTHLGCPVEWLQTPQLFLCPCHGSVFNGDGTVSGGPAPRPLFQYPVRVVNGRVQVRTEAVPLST